MDLLGTVLLSLKLYDNLIGIFEMTSPWGLEVPALPLGRVCVICPIDGPMWLTVDGEAPVQLAPGDSALVMGGRRYRYQSDLSADCVHLGLLWHERGLPAFGRAEDRTGPLRLRWAPEASHPDSVTTRLLALAVMVQEPSRHPLLTMLPPLIVLRESTRRLFPWLPSTLQFLADEETVATPGYAATASHLAQLIITSFIRAHAVDSPDHQPGWLRGLSDPGIGRALACMHGRAGEPWTAESLAREAGMSRATFARRFGALIGRPPIDYLTGCRMQQAAEQLMAGQRSVAEVAHGLGYRSEWAFRQAFSRRFGLPPLRFAKQARAGGASARG